MRAPLTVATTAIEPVAAEWDALADELGASPFLRPGWTAAWCEAFARKAPEVLTVRRGGRLSAAMPVIRDGRRLRSPTNWETPEFGMVATDDDAAAALLVALFDARPWYVTLAYLDAAGITAARLASTAESLGYEALRLPQLRSPVADLPSSWEAFERRLHKGRRSELRRRRRRLEERGALSWEHADGSEGLDGLLDAGFRLEASGWKGREGTAVASSPSARRFYFDVARWAADRGWLRLTFLRLDGEPIAFALGLAVGADHYLLKMAHDEGLRALGPGMLLVRQLVERAIDAGGSSYHFLGTDEPWKLEWADRADDKVRHVLVPSSPVTRGAIWLAMTQMPRLPEPVRHALRRHLG